MPRRLTALPLTALFLTLLLSGCNGCSGPERTVLRGGTDHLPLLHDRVLRYQETENGKTTTYTQRMIYAGGNAIRVYDLEHKGAKRTRTSLLSSGTQVFFETDYPLTAVEDLPYYRELWLDESYEPGASWEQLSLGSSTVFAGYETVTVPAGTYQNCYKTVTTVQPVFLDSLSAVHERGIMTDAQFADLAKRAGMITTRWFARGVGLVKEQFGGPEHVRELVAVVDEGMGVDAPPPEPTTLDFQETPPSPSSPDSGE